jgi:hypothetical protein
MSRVVGAILALPLSQMLSDAVGTLFTGSPFTYTYSFTGALLWLVLSLVLATGASLSGPPGTPRGSPSAMSWRLRSDTLFAYAHMVAHHHPHLRQMHKRRAQVFIPAMVRNILHNRTGALQ